MAPQQALEENVMPIGQALREEREAQGYSLENIASVINIRVGQIRALEDGNLSDLPGMAYAVGFVRAYANFLGIDGEEVVKHFKREHTETPEKPDLALPLPETENNLPDSRVLILSAAGLLFLLIIWSVFSSGDEEHQEIATNIVEIPAELKEATKKAEQETHKILADATKGEEPEVNADKVVESLIVETETKQETTLPVKESAQPELEVAEASSSIKSVPIPQKKKIEPVSQVRNKLKPLDKNAPKILGNTKDKSRVVIRAYKSSWIQVFDSADKIIFKKVLRSGDEYRVPNIQGLKLVTTNAGVLDIYVDGGKVMPIGKVGDIVRGVSLNPGDLTRKRTINR